MLFLGSHSETTKRQKRYFGPRKIVFRIRIYQLDFFSCRLNFVNLNHPEERRNYWWIGAIFFPRVSNAKWNLKTETHAEIVFQKSWILRTFDWCLLSWEDRFTSRCGLEPGQVRSCDCNIRCARRTLKCSNVRTV